MIILKVKSNIKQKIKIKIFVINLKFYLYIKKLNILCQYRFIYIYNLIVYFSYTYFKYI